MKKTLLTLILLAAISVPFLILSSCSDNEDEGKCVTVNVLAVHNDTITGEIINVPDNYVLKDSKGYFKVFSGTKVYFLSHYIPIDLKEGDIVDILLIKYEQYKGFYFTYQSLPILAKKVRLCK